MTPDEIIKELRKAAEEIANEGHAGWGNLCTLAADEIERLRAAQEAHDRLCQGENNL